MLFQQHGGGTDTEIRALKVDPGEENSPATPAGTRARDLSIHFLKDPCLFASAILSDTRILHEVRRCSSPADVFFPMIFPFTGFVAHKTKNSAT